MTTTAKSKTVAKSTIKVDLMGMVRVLMQVKNATPATFVAVTEVGMNKTNNPFFERVTKKQKSNVFINFDYAGSVNRKLLKEGKSPDFVASPRKWGEKLPGTPIVFYKNVYYMEARFLSNEPKVEYFVDAVPTDKAVFETYLKPVSTETSKEHQGVDEVIIIRDFKVANIHSITVNGNTYERNDI